MRADSLVILLLLSMAVAGCLHVRGAPLEVAEKAVVPADPELCMLTSWILISPCDSMEIFAAGVLLSSVGARMVEHRVPFRAAGRMHFTFRLFQANTVRFEPEFDYDVLPGTVLAAQLLARDSFPAEGFGSQQPTWFPSRMEGSPTRVWCWFGRPNAMMDVFAVTLREGADVAAFNARLERDGYKIRKGPLGGSHALYFWIEPRPGYTVVQAVVEIGQWGEVASAQPIGDRAD